MRPLPQIVLATPELHHRDLAGPSMFLNRREHLATAEQRRAILCDNTAELYGIDVAKLV